MDFDSTKSAPLRWYVWVLAWISTSVMGGLFGAAFFLIQGGNVAGAKAGFAVGCYLAAFVGVLVVPVGALLSGLFRLQGHRALRMMAITGGATGLISGLVLGPLCLLTCALGAYGATLPGKWQLAQVR